jgi:hypothetical protein
MPGIDEPARGFVFKRAADREFDAFHWMLSGFIVSQVPEAEPGAPGRIRHGR